MTANSLEAQPKLRILLASIGGGMNEETNSALENFCSGSYGASQFRLDSERVGVTSDRLLGR